MKDFFWLTVSCIKGIGDRTIKRLYEINPFMDYEQLKSEVSNISKKIEVNDYIMKVAEDKATSLKSIHEAKGISIIPISNDYYPKYLKLIDDPPAVLYAKGNVELLKSENLVAIVGTREPTIAGTVAAKKIASKFAELGYVIVSGLALGIDTAGHEGAIRVNGGKTIAVLSGDLTQIYPAKNKELANEILVKAGLWITENPIGSKNMRGNFVKRDRIQSGLSLGVCPVQTPIESGTQHTIKFADEQQILLFTPIPLDCDLNERAVQGNIELINNGTLLLDSKESYSLIHQKLTNYKLDLLNKYNDHFNGNKLKKNGIEKMEQINLFEF